MTQLKLGQYKHFKGGLYEVIAVGKNCETLEDTVVYRALYETKDFQMGQVWTRTLDDFVSTVEVDGREKSRFEYVGC